MVWVENLAKQDRNCNHNKPDKFMVDEERERKKIQLPSVIITKTNEVMKTCEPN